MTVHSLDQLNLKGKRILMRVDYNVPLDEQGAIANDTRIQASLPTLVRLLERDCRVTLMSHLGRPDGAYDARFSMRPAAVRLGELIGQEVALIPDFKGAGGTGPLQMLENLRFSPGETSNDPEFAADLARFGDVYINDAFGAAHRAHASIDAVAKLFKEKGAGLLMMKEIHYLREALKQPDRPFLAILGGSKISDKLKLIGNLLNRVDRLIIGGAMSYTLLQAKGVGVGDSLVEKEFLDEAKRLIKLCQEKEIELLLPLDHVVTQSFKESAPAKITLDEQIEPGYMGMDIGPETINLFTNAIRNSGTVVWNGPMGVFEWSAFSTGTVTVAEAISESPAMTIVGGGDSVAAVYQAGMQDGVTHISTGGGASLELLAGHELPGIVALEVV